MKIVSSEYCRNMGLGNKLFSWARSRIFAKMHPECTMLDAIWFSPHGGAITRGGVDYKKALQKILLFGNFVKKSEDMSLIRYWMLYRSVAKLECVWLKDAENALTKGDVSGRDNHVVFLKKGVGAEGHDFSEFKGWSKFLKDQLLEISSPSARKFIQEQTRSPFIGINVRCGNDFVSKGSSVIGFQKTDLGWFKSALAETRRRYGNLPAVIVSDGGPTQLAELLKEQGTHLLNSKTAIADLMVLASPKVLLGSGNSSFSAWASYLGEMDTFTSKETPFFHGRGLEYGRNGEKILELI